MRTSRDILYECMGHRRSPLQTGAGTRVGRWRNVLKTNEKPHKMLRSMVLIRKLCLWMDSTRASNSGYSTMRHTCIEWTWTMKRTKCDLRISRRQRQTQASKWVICLIISDKPNRNSYRWNDLLLSFKDCCRGRPKIVAARDENWFSILLISIYCFVAKCCSLTFECICPMSTAANNE